MNNGIAAAALGIYLLVVMVRGNSHALAMRLEQEGGFIKWAIAVWIFVYLYESRGLDKEFPWVQSLAGVAIVYFILKVGSNQTILSNIASFWNNLPQSHYTVGGGATGSW